MKKNECCSRLGKAGGQAVLEGVMMKAGDDVALAVRTEDGSIKIDRSKFTSLRKKNKFCNIPVIRGVINFVESLILSMKTLTKSGEMLGFDEIEEESAFDKWLIKHFGDKIYKIISVIAVILGVGLSLCLFMLVPIYITSGIDWLLGGIGWFKNVVAGLIKIGIFVAYIWGVSFVKDIRRTFEYHGAEHKTIDCYEKGLELTPENAAKCTRFHPRCGTSFIFVVLILSIIIFSVISWEMNKFAIMGLRIALLPLVVGIAFEFIMFAGKHPNVITKIFSAPGLLMQRITTREPDEAQIEVAIAAFKAALPDEFPEAADTKDTAEKTDEAISEAEKAADNTDDTNADA